MTTIKQSRDPAVLLACPAIAPPASSLATLATPPEPMIQDWLLADKPEEGRFTVWLSGRFMPGAIPNMLARLRRCQTYAEVHQYLQQRLARPTKHARGARP